MLTFSICDVVALPDADLVMVVLVGTLQHEASGQGLVGF